MGWLVGLVGWLVGLAGWVGWLGWLAGFPTAGVGFPTVGFPQAAAEGRGGRKPWSLKPRRKDGGK